MRVVWLHDATLKQVKGGGAERTNDLLFRAMPDLVDLSFLTFNDLISPDQLRGDLLIVSNVKRFSTEQLEWVVVSETPKVRVERDYWNLIDESHRSLRKDIWDSSMAGVFTSPAHRDEYLRLYPDIDFPETLLTIPSPIEAYKFWRGKKENIIVYIGALDIHKGIVDVLNWAENKGAIVVVHGEGRLANWVASHPNARYGGIIPYDDIANLLSRANVFIHKPVWVEPYGRSVIEARLSGCNLVINDRIGCLSYDWWQEENSYLRYFLPKQGEVFWNAVLSLL